MRSTRVVPAHRLVLVLVFVVLACVLLPLSAVAQESPPTATVLVSKLNVRSGPGTGYSRLGTVSAGDVLAVVGQANKCAWLKVQTPAALEGWVSGSVKYVTLDTPCANITAAAAPAATSAAKPAATSTATSAEPAAQPTATPVPPTATPLPPPPPPAASAPEETPLPEDKGCILWENFLGPELTVTLTRKSNGNSEVYKVPPHGNLIVCIWPDDYAVTIDAPPPWADINADFKIAAGEQGRWPIQAAQ